MNACRPHVKYKARHIYPLSPNLSFSFETLIISNYVRDNASGSQCCFQQYYNYYIV